MTTTVVFLQELKSAANNYLSDKFTRFKNIFNYSSAESRDLASILSRLDSADPASIVDAVTAIDTYIQATGTSNYVKRRFWDDHLQPILHKLAHHPLTDLNENDKATLQDLEFTPRSALNRIQQHSALLYNGMGYDESAVKRHPKLSKLLTTEDGLDACKTDLVAETFRRASPHNKTSELAPGRVLKLFFAQNIPLPSVQPFSYASQKQQPFFDLCLDMMDWDELLILLKSIRPNHPSIKSVFPSILFKIAQDFYDVYSFKIESIPVPARQALFLKLNQVCIECLIELKRLGLETLTAGQLLGIVTRDKHAFFRDKDTITSDEVANAIVAAPSWNTVLSNRQGPLPLTALLPTQSAEAILAAVGAKVIELQPGARRLSMSSRIN